ncbi:hypothetical protein [Gulosibacter molinativorax]|uniref:hypothetical protein n=1 Tax=Gulosibacter molinativorax TaxID=256821 RepID=UPI0003FCCBA8|nr:hypothetical protein [Gulosibacter molinativorax]QUY62108.1 Hypotetical protein [Gulosibacter molinativorax]
MIEVDGEISGSPMITLPPGTTLRGGTLRFGARGVRLTADNTLEDVTIVVPDHETAITNDTSVSDLGTLTLRNVTTHGQVLILAKDQVRSGHVQVEGVHVASADVRGRAARPHGFGVDALQGGFTLWNMQADPGVSLTAELLDISAGSAETPIRGSGVFVGGHGDWDGKADGGTIRVARLRTGEIHTDGGIPEGTPDLISGGVFVISGATVENVESVGPVTTYGQNDMVLDNWGAVHAWTATAPVTSHGPSGIGFVNFGDIGVLDVQSPIVTTGKGARGFNLYDGSLDEARFESIATTGDGSIGIQVSKPLRRLSVAGDVTTTGGEGLSLVKGVQVTLQAIALSVKRAGYIEMLEIGGKLATGGDNVPTLEVEGTVDTCNIGGGVFASGQNADAVHLNGGQISLDGVELSAAHGEAIRDTTS